MAWTADWPVDPRRICAACAVTDRSGIAAVLPRRAVERAFDQAEVLEIVDARQIADVLARAGGHRGAGTLRTILEEHAPGSTLTRNDLEEAFLAICRAAKLPQPVVNAWIPLEPTGGELLYASIRPRRIA